MPGCLNIEKRHVNADQETRFSLTWSETDFASRSARAIPIVYGHSEAGQSAVSQMAEFWRVALLAKPARARTATIPKITVSVRTVFGWLEKVRRLRRGRLVARRALRAGAWWQGKEGNTQTSSGFVGHYVSFRLAFLAVVIFLMVLGCATSNPSESASEDRIWSAQLARQQQAAREAGRIGYIGNAGPACQ